jgi:hypothetical protein
VGVRPAVGRNEEVWASRERRFPIKSWLPTLDGFVADLLSSSFNRLYGEIVDHEDAARQSGDIVGFAF